MILELNDSTQLEVIRILGGPRIINGITRDTLSIEIDPSYMDLKELTSIFNNPDKTNHLYSYMNYENESNVKTLIAEGYNIFISSRTETRKVDKMPGFISQDEFENIHVINIAQLTYEEYQLYLNGNWIPPNISN